MRIGQITALLVEGGGTLLGSFFDLGLIDKVVALISPVIIGGGFVVVVVSKGVVCL